MHRFGLLLILPTLGLLLPDSIPPAMADGGPPSGRESFPETEPPPETVVARIDGVELTLRELLIRYAHLPSSVRYRYTSRENGLESFLRNTAEGMALARKAREAGISDHHLFEVLERIHREEILRDLYARETIFGGIDDELLRHRYEEQRETRFTRLPRVELRQILVTPVDDPLPEPPAGDATNQETARRKIRELHRQLQEGADFARLARWASEGPTAESGGHLGWVERGELLPILTRAAFVLEPGEVSEPIESDQGLHLLQVTARRPGGLVPFPLVRELLFQEIVGERMEELSSAARTQQEKALEERDVELFPERLPW